MTVLLQSRETTRRSWWILYKRRWCLLLLPAVQLFDAFKMFPSITNIYQCGSWGCGMEGQRCHIKGHCVQQEVLQYTITWSLTYRRIRHYDHDVSVWSESVDECCKLRIPDFHTLKLCLQLAVKISTDRIIYLLDFTCFPLLIHNTCLHVCTQRACVATCSWAWIALLCCWSSQICEHRHVTFWPSLLSPETQNMSTSIYICYTSTHGTFHRSLKQCATDWKGHVFACVSTCVCF